MVDNGENILVEFDYDNISIIDPNMVIDQDGKVKERLVKQENLVYYANLECNVLPRTKLALGTSLNDSNRTISVGSINFLNPGKKTFLDNSYTDEITGKNTLKGEGVNQPKQTAISNPNKSNDFYLTQTQTSNGQPGSTDSGLLGITSIRITINTSFQPVIDIDLEDVKGRALFEAGDNSPYAVFFQLPYPIFYLTLKGYYGKAVRFPIMLQNFTSSFDPTTHNFRIKLKFYGYKYTIMSYVNWGGMLAVPHMYNSTLKISETQGGQSTNVIEKNTSRGYQKMKELYSEYKSKGLIADDFPELTITQLNTKLDTFIKDILDKFSKENLGVLTEITNYISTMNDYQNEVFFSSDSWANKYLDTRQPYILNGNEKTKVYTFKKDLNLEKRTNALNELKQNIIPKYNEILAKNPVFGTNGKYIIDGKENASNIANSITYDKFVKTPDIRSLLDSQLNLTDTYLIRNNNRSISGETVLQEFKEKIRTELTNENSLGLIAFQFEGKQSFIDTINDMSKQVQTTKKNIEEEITKSIQNKFNDKNNGLGFIPTIRNVMAVFFAQAEAFLRLMDDVHTKAWDVRDSKYRKAAIFSQTSSAPSVDYKDVINDDSIVYPWPQLIVESIGNDNEEKFELKYPGDLALSSQYQSYVPEIWPEVEFVEEFIKGYTERDTPQPPPEFQGDISIKPNRLSLNAVDFPVNNEVLQNVQEVKFFYEIYERIMINSFYSRLNRPSAKSFGVYTVEAEIERENILKALGNDNPFLAKKIKEYNLNSSNFLTFLRHISNQGEGESWQKFIRGEITTPYIKTDTLTPFSLYEQTVLDNEKTKPDLSISTIQKLEDYLSNVSVSNEFEIGDVYPIVDLNWSKNNLADGQSLQNSVDTYKTSDVILFNNTHKTITNFLTTDTNDIKRPFTNFNFKRETLDGFIDLSNLKTFYQNRTIKDQFVTEGNVNYVNYDGSLVYNQTTSMLNTPYYVNAIQNGVFNFRYNQNNTSPYKAAAYLFLNSLPLATLREKYKTHEAPTDLSYILSTFKKFGATHKLPYSWVLKYGSIWYRYKNWKNTGNDILDDVWKNFDYKTNYDPVNSATTKDYQINVFTKPYNVVLENTTQNITNINVGFYPNVIDDFNVFYQGLKIFTGGTQLNGTCTISGTTLTVQTISDNVLNVGGLIFGDNITNGTEIVNQIDGTPGGIGNYTINISQTIPTETVFVVPNAPKTPYTSTSIQNTINNNELYVIPSDGSKITKQTGFDTTNPNRSLNVTTWSILSSTKTKEATYVLPSFGSNVNQTESECFKTNGQLKIELTGNTAIYDGSVRSFWLAPHYGYFDHNKLLRPNPEQYLKQILNEQRQQQNFLIDGDNSKYTTIDEMFTTFDKSILDLFETEFLNFSRSCYDYKSTLITFDEDINGETNQNFQLLMRELMKVPKPTQTTPNAIIDEVIQKQKEQFITTMDSFLNYNVIFRNGNPMNFDKRVFYTFSTQFLIDPIQYNGYNQSTPGLLPFSGGNITVAQSKAIYPEAWKALELHIGFSEIPQLKYTNNGSYITDFFIDLNVQFETKNVIDFAPLIKIYATEKLKDPTMNRDKFYTLMNDYIDESNNYINTVIDTMMPQVRGNIKNIEVTDTRTRSNLQGEQTRIELWELFKSINDTWIAGYDLKNKTLFEDVLLFDRASRDVGQKIIVDIFKVKELIDKRQYKNSFLDIINTILVQNNFVYFNLPSFANFYNVQDAQKNPIPRNEGSLEFANTLFGTFLNVDYRETSPKLLCYYANKNSEHLDMKNNIDYRFRNDAFDLRRASDNPLVQSLQNKTDWDKTNKVVGFNVDIGRQNQQIFKQFDVSQSPGKPTAESLEVLNQMANIDKNRTTSTQNNSLYNLYKNRSYSCSVDMMGNVLIQPMMYFNLRNVPMFSGPYLITSVAHTITENGFDTTFEGTRQPFYALPKIENFIQSLSIKVLKTIQEKIKSQDQQRTVSPENILTQQSVVIDNVFGTDKLTTNQECGTKIVSPYTTYTTVTAPQKTTITFKEAKKQILTRIKSRFPSIQQTELGLFGLFIFSSMYMDTNTTTGFSTYENNYSTINLTTTYASAGNKYFNQKYFCLSRGNNINNIPVVSFNSFNDYLDFFIERFANRSTLLNDGLIETFVKVYVLYWPSEQPPNVYNNLTEQQKNRLSEKMSEAWRTYNAN